MNVSNTHRKSSNKLVDSIQSDELNAECKQEESPKDHYDREENSQADYVHKENADSHYDQEDELINDSEE